MNEELLYTTSEEQTDTENSEIIESELNIETTDEIDTIEETEEIIEVEPIEEIEIEVDEAIGWVGGDSERHYSLLGRDEHDQHPITAITGLRDELDEIERLKTVCADKPNIATYYEWNDGAYDEYGYFVSLVPNTSKVQICKGVDILGVTVKERESVGFVGGDNQSVPRDNTYCLVVSSGLVSVRCEIDVKVGDFVAPNSYGVAEKVDNNYGYEVVALGNIDGVSCAIIDLQIQMNQIRTMAGNIEALDERVDAAEINIVAAINVAQEAYNKVSECIKSGANMSGQINDALGVVEGIVDDMDDLRTQISDAALISVQAKAIADSAVSSAESIRSEAVKRANEALDDTSQLREELNVKAIQMQTDLDKVALRLEVTKEELKNADGQLRDTIDNAIEDLESLRTDLEPLATWPLVITVPTWKNEASALTDVIYYDAQLEMYHYYNGNTWLAGEFSSPVPDIKKIYHVQELKIYWYYKNAHWQYTRDLKVAGVTSYSGFVARADETSAILATMVGCDFDKGDTLAGFTQEATNTHALVSSLAKYNGEDRYGNGVTGVAGLIAQVDANKASIATLAGFDGNVAGMIAKIDETASILDMLASHPTGNYIAIQTWNADNVEKNNTSKIYYQKNGDIESYYYYINNWQEVGHFSDIDVLSTMTVYYVTDTSLYWYYDDEQWKFTSKMSEAGLEGAIVGIQQIADENKAQLDEMAAYDKNGASALAGITAYVDENSAQISQLAKYDKKGTNDTTASTGVAGLIAQVTENQAKIESLANLEGDGFEGLAGLVARVEKNESAVDLVSQYVRGNYTVIPELVDENKRNTQEFYYDSENQTYWYYDTSNTQWASDSNFTVLPVSQDTIYYVVGAKLYWHYVKTDDDIGGRWESTTGAYDAGLPASIGGIQVVTDANSSSINNLVAWQGDTITSMARIEQKADANGAYIQSTVSNMDRYSVGPHSQAYGFTLEQARSVLEDGMVYVPTQSHSEIYKYTDSDKETKNYPDDDGYQFTKGYTYTWTDIGSSEMMWRESIGEVVFFGSVPSGESIGFWYTDTNEVSEGYAPYTLYKREKRDDGSVFWIAVTTLAGYSQSRAVSQIRQDANSIELDITNVKGDLASIKIWAGDDFAAIQDVVEWKEDNGEAIATTMQKASDSEAYIAQIASVKNPDGTVNASASIITAVNNDKSGVVIKADHVELDGLVSFVNGVKDNAVYNTRTEYARSSSATNFVATTEWSTVAPEWKSDEYMWQKTVIVKGNGDESETEPVCIQGARGADGTGVAIKGVAYADSTIGDDSVGNKYTLYSDDDCTNQIANASDGDAYLVDGYLFVYNESDGLFACTGKIQGPTGESGLSVFIAYNNSTTTPSAPTGDGTSGGWYTNATSSSVWISIKVAADATSGTWGAPIKIKGTTGATGASVTGIVSEYCFSLSNTTIPTSGWSSNFKDVWEQSENTGYIWRREKVTYSNGRIEYTTATVDGASSAVVSWCSDNDQTLINGGKIAAHSIKAEQMDVNAITSLNYKQNASGDTISGSRLSLADGSFDSQYFKISSAGAITATSGKVGGFNIDSTTLRTDDYKLAGDTTTRRSGFRAPTTEGTSPHGSSDIALAVGYQYNAAWTTAPFRVTFGGKLYADAADITGTIHATDGEFTGTITATSGKIANYQIDGARLYVKKETDSTAGSGIMSGLYAGNPSGSSSQYANKRSLVTPTVNGSNYYSPVRFFAGSPYTTTTEKFRDGKFVVLEDGSLYASAANITGTINATSGTFQNCTLSGTNSATTISSNGLSINSKSLGNATCEVSASGLYVRTNSDSKTINAPMIFGSLTTDIGTNTVYSNTNGLYVGTNGSANLHSNQSILIVADTDGAMLNLRSNGTMSLYSGTSLTLGNSSHTNQTNYMYGTWKLNTSSTVTSDKNLKHDIASLDDDYSNLFDALIPARFKYNNGTSNRYHTGFIAQDVRDATTSAGLTTNDFAAYVEFANEDGNIECGLRYEEFVSLNTWQIQKLKARVVELENKIALLTSEN